MTGEISRWHRHKRERSSEGRRDPFGCIVEAVVGLAGGNEEGACLETVLKKKGDKKINEI